MEDAQAVLNRLPAQGLTRAQLAAQELGDAHARPDAQPTWYRNAWRTRILVVAQPATLTARMDRPGAHGLRV
ncbi:hypothetical protein ACFS07_18570 [Undibacterium arcticum]